MIQASIIIDLEEGCYMLSGIEFNKGYTSSYIMLPLNKNGMLTVVSTDKELDAKIKARNSIQNLDELREADTDGNGILSLEEIKNCKNKTDFLKKLELAMEKFNANLNRDYSKNLFEDWV